MQITIKVMSESGTKCLLSIAEQMPIALFVSSICDAALDPHAMCRAQVSLFLLCLPRQCQRDLVYVSIPAFSAHSFSLVSSSHARALCLHTPGGGLLEGAA
jgi:hypothetical protein